MDRSDWGEPRSRTLTWHDPMAAAAAGATMSGLDYLRAVAAGELPPAPISSHFAMTVVSVDPGEVVFECLPDESAYNPIGLVHGGLVCTLLDSVTGCAVHTTLPAGTAYTSIELKVSYLRPVRADTGLLTARGRVVKAGRKVAFAEGEVLDAAGKVLASATTSCLVMPG
ncbi:MAG: PaaI family thioesterase [Frankiales bacterium]|nr:PaaI family thioesterase [Frankiales bacterium]